MSEFERLTVPEIEGFSVSLTPPNQIALSGVLATPYPRRTVGVFFEAVHRAAVADRLSTVELNLRDLSFVNSSAIRLFVDLVNRTCAAPADQSYQLHFLVNRKITWQRTSFNVLRSLAPGSVQITAG